MHTVIVKKNLTHVKEVRNKLR